jgi:hypothetical protein
MTLRGNVLGIGSPTSFGGADVTWFMSPTQVPLIDPTYFVVDGQPKNGGFEYSFTIDSAPQSGANVVEVAVNQAGQQLVALGTPTAAFTKVISQGLDGKSTSASPAVLPAGVVAPLTSGRRTGSFYTEWLDPINLVLNAVLDQISWTYDGTHVTSFSGGPGLFWDSQNGWHLTSSPYTGSYYNADHSWATIYTNASFETGSWFPPTCGTSDTYYYANNVYGGPNGQLSGGVNTWASSGCLYLLHYWAGTSG